MKFFEIGLILSILLISNISEKINAENSQSEESQLSLNGKEGAASNNETILTADLYAKLFKERRKEQQFMAKQMLKSAYEKNYKLLQLVYGKIFEVIHDSNATLNEHEYTPTKSPGESFFPQTNAQLQQAVIFSLENCCIAAENVLHFPEISYRIFRKTKLPNWKPLLNWCINFVNALPHIIDESTVKLMNLLQQEINEELRTENYINPYDSRLESQKPAKLKKPPKKLKRGPQLSANRNEL